MVVWPGALRAESRRYLIVPAESAVRVFAYREGVFSLLAHDHVVLARDLSGQVTVDPADLAHASVTLRIGVAAMQVDDEAERKRAGFGGELGVGDRKSIREAMLGPEVLHAELAPEVTVESQQVSGALPNLQIAARVRIRGQEHVLPVPATVTLDASGLTAKGKFAFRQSEFGITPYKALLGAIAVQDRVVVEFDLAAAAQP